MTENTDHIDGQLMIGLPPVSRSSDPDTSHAAEAALTSRQTLMNRLFRVIEQTPSTTEEAGRAAGIVPWQEATKRISDLKNVGLIRDSGERKVGSSGRKAIIWKSTAG